MGVNTFNEDGFTYYLGCFFIINVYIFLRMLLAIYNHVGKSGLFASFITVISYLILKLKVLYYNKVGLDAEKVLS